MAPDSSPRCTLQLRAEGKPAPKSGCAVCGSIITGKCALNLTPLGLQQLHSPMPALMVPLPAEVADRQWYEYGVRAAAHVINKRAADYHNEHGSQEHDTGAWNYPGDGAETMADWAECEEAILALIGAPLGSPWPGDAPPASPRPLLAPNAAQAVRDWYHNTVLPVIRRMIVVREGGFADWAKQESFQAELPGLQTALRELENLTCPVVSAPWNGAQPDPLDMPLPCDVQVPGARFAKGVSLRIFVDAARRWKTAAGEAWAEKIRAAGGALPALESTTPPTEADGAGDWLKEEAAANVPCASCTHVAACKAYMGCKAADEAEAGAGECGTCDRPGECAMRGCIGPAEMAVSPPAPKQFLFFMNAAAMLRNDVRLMGGLVMAANKHEAEGKHAEWMRGAMPAGYAIGYLEAHKVHDWAIRAAFKEVEK